jgi:hypothetical protein
MVSDTNYTTQMLKTQILPNPSLSLQQRIDPHHVKGLIQHCPAAILIMFAASQMVAV